MCAKRVTPIFVTCKMEVVWAFFFPPRFNCKRDDNGDPFFFVDGRPKARTAASIILRGPNDFYCDEMERSVHDALCVVKRVLESKTVVVGGGAVEVALSIYLESFATSLVFLKEMNKTIILLRLSLIDVNDAELEGTAGHRRVCSFIARHPEDAGRQCRQGCDRPGSQAQIIPSLVAVEARARQS